MTHTLHLGTHQFPNRIIQGPLAGISCAPFRRLTWRYSQPAFSCTEMISCNTLIHQKAASQHRFVYKAPDEGPVCFQLAGNDPFALGQATQIATDYGADLIDLNCGCPVNKIRRQGAGSSLLMDAKLLYQLIRAMKQHTHVPVSIKIRVEGHGPDRFHHDIAQAIEEAGADFVTVHGRHWTEHYETPCNYDNIAFFVQRLKIPVIGNGDVADVASLQTMLATGCAGVMIGRAGVGQPWLIGELTAALNHTPFNKPALTEVGAMFIEHVVTLSELLASEKFAILQARKMAKYYGRELTRRSEFCDAINRCETLDLFTQLCQRYFA